MILRPLALIVLPALAAGCGPVNQSLESVHQAVVDTAEIRFDLALAGGTAAPGEAARLAAWMETNRIGFGDRITVAGEGGRRAVTAALARRGMVADLALLPAERPDLARIVVHRSTALVPGCPDWRRASSPELAGSTMSNFGCATNTNFAAMVADKEDLVIGKALPAESDAAGLVKAVRVRRDAEPSGKGELKRESTGERQ